MNTFFLRSLLFLCAWGLWSAEGLPRYTAASVDAVSAATNPKYSLTVSSGTGGGSYEAGAKVTVTASTISGKEFTGWTGNTTALSSLASVTAAQTTCTMPAANITITAGYRLVYALTVTNGTGSGNYPLGTQVTVTANAAPSGQRFAAWTGDTSFLGSTSATTTTCTMPPQAVSITANYEAIPAVTVTANAGPDQTITTSGSSITVRLNGSLSTSSVGGITSYTWSEYGTTLASGATPLVALTPGIHDITLKTFHDTYFATDVVRIIVKVTGDVIAPTITAKTATIKAKVDTGISLVTVNGIAVTPDSLGFIGSHPTPQTGAGAAICCRACRLLAYLDSSISPDGLSIP